MQITAAATTPQTEKEFRPAARKQTSLLAALEHRALLWFAARLPARVNSDHLTALGFLAMVGAGACYWWAASHPGAGLAAVTLCLAANWFGDSLDGTLARFRNQQRPRYGFYIDHILDSLGSAFLFGGLALSGYMSPGIAAGILIAYLLLSIEVFLATYTVGRFQISFGAFSPTELRLLLVAGNVALLWKPTVVLAGREFLLFDVGGVCGIAGMTAITLHSAIRHSIQLYREETNW